MRIRYRLMANRAAAAFTLAASTLFLAMVAGPLQAAPESGMGPAPKARPSLKDTLIPIPWGSRDVPANGCQARQAPVEKSRGHQSDLAVVPFWRLVEHAAGPIAVHMTVAGPDAYMRKIAPLDDDMRRLVLLYTLWDRLGRDGLHTFFSTQGGAVAPALRDALQGAGLAREFVVFSRAMALFGEPYPVAEDVRDKFFGSSTAGKQLNEFDHRMLALSHEFGSRESLADKIVAYVDRTVPLWQRIEGLREKLGDPERMRLLTDGLSAKVDLGQPYAEIQRQLSALTKQQRTLLVLTVFNDEFENGGVHQFFYNSSGAIAPEVHDAMIEIGLDRQAELVKRGLALFNKPYMRETQRRREAYFHKQGGWNDWDQRLSALTDDFYALDGGPVVYTMGGGATIEGGPGIRHAMLAYALRNRLLPC